MELKLETLLQVMFANNQEALIAKAVKIDTGIPEINPDEIIIQIQRSDLAPRTKFKSQRGDDNPSYGYVKCPIVVVNPYKIDKQYTVQLPNGKMKAECSHSNNTITEIENIPTTVTTEAE